MSTIEKLRIKWPKPWGPGFEIAWVQCLGCKRLMHYVHQPYSLSNPILTKNCCSHGLGGRWSEQVRTLTFEQAAPLYIEQRIQAWLEKVTAP